MPKQYSSPPEMAIDINKTYSVTIHTNHGEITLELFASEVPATVNNFVFLARDGFYQDGGFHRVIKDFMVQGGCPKGDGTGGPGYCFDDEPVTRSYVKGTLAMANAGPPIIDGMAPGRIADLLSAAVAEKHRAREVA